MLKEKKIIEFYDVIVKYSDNCEKK